MTYVLLTRPEEDCQEIQSKTIVPTLSSPLLKVQQSVDTVNIPKKTTDLIVTSARVFEMVKNLKEMTKIPVWCVGEATAVAAKESGFETIFQVNRSAQEILERIVNECPKETSHFVHICGSVVHVDLADALTKLGYHASRIVIYTTEAADSLTPEAEAIMSAGLVQQMPFFSLRTAEVFIDIARKSEWAENLSKITALAHSEAIARSLNQLSWKRVIVVPDLSAERIQEYYIRSGDSTMKKANTLLTLVFIAGVAGITSVAVQLVWPSPNQKPDPVNLAPLLEKIETLNATIVSVKTKQNEIDSLRDKIATLEEKITTPHQQQDTPAENPPKEQSPPKDLTQNLEQLRHQILHGLVSPETLATANQLLPHDQLLGQSILSIRDLKDKLQHLPDLMDEVAVDAKPSIGEKATEILGLNIRKTQESPLKKQALDDLNQGKFSFIVDLEKKTLSPDWVQWLNSCKATEQAINTVSSILDQKENN
ncbi:MAG: uroporphyrinogen-III synthase [Candidatus Paracaedibacteraceae bacterium]|nr:uroporphyrinogen-III synthase [Candidatus Paracaedibacteraceae bacterium]